LFEYLLFLPNYLPFSFVFIIIMQQIAKKQVYAE